MRKPNNIDKIVDQRFVFTKQSTFTPHNDDFTAVFAIGTMAGNEFTTYLLMHPVELYPVINSNLYRRYTTLYNPMGGTQSYAPFLDKGLRRAKASLSPRAKAGDLGYEFTLLGLFDQGYEEWEQVATLIVEIDWKNEVVHTRIVSLGAGLGKGKPGLARYKFEEKDCTTMDIFATNVLYPVMNIIEKELGGLVCTDNMRRVTLPPATAPAGVIATGAGVIATWSAIAIAAANSARGQATRAWPKNGLGMLPKLKYN